MADIINKQAVDFINQRIRTNADRMVQDYYKFKVALALWSANGQNITALVPNDSSPVADGSELTNARPDGRSPITGAHVNNVIARMNEHVTDMEASGNAKLNTLLAVCVNPQG